LKEFKQTVIKALLPHIILLETSDHPIHGYALITLIRKKHGIYLGPSTMYPALAELEKQGLIQSSWNMVNDRPRKMYAITNKGRILLGQTTRVLTFVNRAIEVKAT
jgi:DNA-binding PadR family transcriptional regulator